MKKFTIEMFNDWSCD